MNAHDLNPTYQSPAPGGRRSRLLPASKYDLDQHQGQLATVLTRLERKLDQIMATESEIIIQLKDISQGLKDGNAAIDALKGEVSKVGAETDTLNQKITDLQAIIAKGGTISQELVDAVADVATQAGTVKSGIQTVTVAVQAVDDKVPDAPAAS